MRLDKFLCEMEIGTRTQVKGYIRQGLVTVNGSPAAGAQQQINENTDAVCFRGQRIVYSRFVYYMLNKPAGVVSATEDKLSPTVLGLLKAEDRRDDIFPAGRLDKDTEGFLLLTNDGELAHRLLSPKRHVDKTYLVGIEVPLSPADISALESGVDIGDPTPTLPAVVRQAGERSIFLTLREGRYHQVKRMLFAVGNHVTSLKRVSFGALTLDGQLAPGEYRALTEQEVHQLYEA